MNKFVMQKGCHLHLYINTPSCCDARNRMLAVTTENEKPYREKEKRGNKEEELATKLEDPILSVR